MSYASGTTHYNLPQTVGSDKRDWTDTNQAFSDIDAAIYGAAQGASAATSAIQTINGQIETITAAQAVDEGNISTLSGKVSTLESTVGTQGAAIADVRQDLQDNIESKREASATSTHAYEVGDTFYYNDVLYKATAQIAIGGTIVPSTNCTAVTVMSELQAVDDKIPTTLDPITVTAGESETIAALCNRLYALIDTTKVTKDSCIKYATFYSRIVENSSNDLAFSQVELGSTGTSFIRQQHISSSDSKWLQMGLTTSATTFNDYSASGAISAGVPSITFYY